MKVSVITPTSRPENLPRLKEIFYSQDYPHKELIIVEGDGSVGAKRNKACEAATGDIIIHFDDDDIYAPDFISQSVAFIRAAKADVTGLSRAYFYQQKPERAWLYDYIGDQPYVLGSGMCYYRRVWERNRFRNITHGEDRYFLANAGIIKAHNYMTGFIQIIHGKNTAAHRIIAHMKPVSPEYLKKLVPNLFNFTSVSLAGDL